MSGALPGGVTFIDNGDNTATLSGTPEAGTGGNYSLSLNAGNGFAPDATQTFMLTVTEITSLPIATFLVGTAGSFTVTTAGTPPPTLAAGGLPAETGITFTDNGDGTATLAGTPLSGSGGVYGVPLTAQNIFNADAQQPFTLIINEAPAIVPPDHVAFKVGELGSFTVTATGYPLPTLSATALPPALSSSVKFDPDTRIVSGTPDAGTGGMYSITFTANNGVGTPAAQNFNLTVNETPAITSANQITFTVGQFSSFAVTTSHAFPALISLAESGTLPSGINYIDNGDGTGTISGTPDEFTGNTYPIIFTADNGTAPTPSQDFSLMVMDIAPAFTSPPTATPSQAGVGQMIQFSAAASGTSLTYSWNFGDGVQGAGANVMHSYGAAGMFTASVTVSNGPNSMNPVSLSTTVTVKSPVIGSGNDSDGDGFSDDFEIAVGTDPHNSGSTPFGGASAGVPMALSLVKPAIQLNFAKKNADSIKFGGSLTIPAGFVAAGQAVDVYIGGVVAKFTLGSKGTAANGNSTFKAAIKSTKGAVPSQISKFTVLLNKGNFGPTLTAAGLTNASVKNVMLPVPFILLIDKTAYTVSQSMTYTATKGKSGSAK